MVRYVLSLLALTVFAASALPAPAADELTWNWGRDRTYDLEHYRLDIHLNPEVRDIKGQVELRIRSLRDGLDRIELDLVDLEVDQVRRPGSDMPEFTHRDGVLEIRLDDPVDRDDALTLLVEYHGQPTKGLYWVQPDRAYPHKSYQIWSQSEMEDARYWWPTWDFPNDRATSEVHVTVPNGYKAVSNGELAHEYPQERGRRTFVWKMDVPHVTYLTSVAVGKWEEESEVWEGIPLHYYVPPGRKADIPRTFSDTADMMEFFSELTGRKYPYARYNQVVVSDYIYGGMENIAATTLTEDTLHDERAHVDSPSTGLIAHELAHQWFGDLITCENWAHTWLNEGFATYYAALYTERRFGRDEFLRRVHGMRSAAVGADRGSGRRPVVSYKYRDPYDLFDGHAYSKGGYILHMLKDVLGEERYHRAIRRYVRDRAETVADTDDLQDAVEASEGDALTWFFRQWLYRPGQPDVEASWSWERETEGAGGRVRVRLEQTQEDEEGLPPFRFPLTIRVISRGEDGSVLRVDHRVEVRERTESFVFRRSARPEAVVLDPEASVLWTVELDRGREEWSFLLEHGGNALVRANAATQLGTKRPPGPVTDALSRALAEDPDYAVRVAAASALGTVRGESARDALLAGLRAETDSRARSAIARALGEFPEDSSIARLLRERIVKDDSYAVRSSSIAALADLEGEDAWPVIRRALGQDSHRETVRGAVWNAAERLHAVDALPEALEWSRYGRPSRARRAALGAVGNLGWEREAKDRRPLAEEVERILEEDRDMFVRSAAAGALGNLGVPSSAAVLRRASTNDPQERVRRAARRALREHGRRSSADADRGELLRRIEKMEEESREVRRELEELQDRLDTAAPEEAKATP